MQNLVTSTRDFALSVIHLYDLPRRRVAYVLGSQFLNSGTSPGAHSARRFVRARRLSTCRTSRRKWTHKRTWCWVRQERGRRTRQHLLLAHQEVEVL